MKKRRRKRKGGHYHRGLHVSPKAGECKFRSGWEQAYMIWLDSNVDVTSYTYEKTIIEYVSNKKTGKIRKYFPDFLVEYSDHSELIEIKPAKRLEQARVKKKLAAAELWCTAHGIVFRVITENELRPMGLIKR